MIGASRRICVFATSLLNRVPGARSNLHIKSTRTKPLLGLKCVHPYAHAHQPGICIAGFQRRHSSALGGQRFTEDELAIVRDAHAARKSAGETLELLDSRNHLSRLIKKAIGSRRGQREHIKSETFTVSGRWSQDELELLKLRLIEGKTYRGIAEELGRSQRSVDSRVERGVESEYRTCT